MTEFVKNDWRLSDALTAIKHNDVGKNKVEAGRDFRTLQLLLQANWKIDIRTQMWTSEAELMHCIALILLRNSKQNRHKGE